MNPILVVVLMGCITVLFRVAPLLSGWKLQQSAGGSSWLASVPLAVLGALIVPDIFQVDKQNALVGIAAGATAVALTLWGKLPTFATILIAALVALVVKLSS
ncbi:MAG TPA: AzlD domain-containing protein [Roseiflexaceae bacterium]|nr:AzlD domain-containing protein [Roseiflexaceae bacterium]